MVFGSALGRISREDKRKWLMRAKLTVLIMVVVLVQVSASTRAQVTLNENRAPLQKVLKTISKQSGYDLIYSIDDLKGTSLVNLKLNNVSVERALELCLAGQPLVYQIADRTVMIKRKEDKGLLEKIVDYFRDIDVTGRVLDSNGEPLVGATVRLKGTDKVTTTDANGDYMLKGVPEDGLIVISFVGYRVMEIEASKDRRVSRLELIDNALEEVKINAGYYSVTDRERTGSIVRVTAKDIENQPVSNVLSAVQGRMAGVNIKQNGGMPGGGFQIEIRGQNSLRTTFNSGIDGNLPMYVVDGVPIGSEVSTQFAGAAIPRGSINPLNNIAPDDIESIEVLKDADATSIYGSRGANGVVLVTTKKGKSGKLELSVNSMFSFSNAMSNLEMMNTEQYLDMRRKAFANNNVVNYPATAYDVNGTWQQDRYTNWREMLIGNTAASANHQLSVKGGSETTSFLLGLGMQQQGTVYDSDFKYRTVNLSNNLSHRSRDGRFQVTVSSHFSNQKNNVINEDMTNIAHRLSPNAPELYRSDGGLNWQNNTFSNPIAAFNADYSYDNFQLLNNVNASYALVPTLQFRVSGGLNYLAFEEWSIRPNTIYNPAYVTGQSSQYSQSSKYDENKFSYIIEPQLQWGYKKDVHQLDVLMGGSFQSDVKKQGSITGSGFESNVFIRNIAAAQTRVIGDQISTEYRYAAVFGRINYQFDKKYILNITGRRDGSSRFGPNKRYANFAAVGVAWILSDEKFLGGIPWLSLAKLRGSYGLTGSDNIGDFQYMDTYSISTAASYNGVTGIIPSRLYNPDYSWEKTAKFELALDLALFNNKLALTAAYYRNRSSNQLVGYQLPAITGFTTVNANLDATVQNTGVELELNGRALTNGKFQWETGLNISFPRNKLISFPGLAGSTYSSSYIIGQPLSITRLYHLQGIDPQTKLYVFTDFNQDGRIASIDDRQVLENLGVNYFGGWNNSFRYQNWSLSFLLQFVKQKSRNYNSTIGSPGLMNNLPVQALDVWSAENPDGLYMPYRSSSNALHSLFQSSTASVSDGSFLRLKNVGLAYQLPMGTGKVFRDIKVYFQAHNLLTFTNYFGMDPEIGSSSFLPPLRTYAFGFQFTL